MGTKYVVSKQFSVDETVDCPLMPGLYVKGSTIDCTAEQGRFLERHGLGEPATTESVPDLEAED